MCSEAWLQLSNYVKEGIRLPDKNLLISIQEVGGSGILWIGFVQGRHISLWIPEEEWYHWINHIVPANDLSQLSVFVLQLLSDWTFKESIGLLFSEQSKFLLPQKQSIANQTAFCIEKTEKGKTLTICFLSFVEEHVLHWLRQEISQSDKVETIPFDKELALAVGWQDCALQDIKKWERGAVLLLEDGLLPVEKKFWLVKEGALQGKVTWISAEEKLVEIVKKEDSIWPPKVLEEENLSFTVFAEFGRLQVSQTEIEKLSVGQTLSGITRFDEVIYLTIFGKRIATGSLLNLDGKLAVQLTDVNIHALFPLTPNKIPIWEAIHSVSLDTPTDGNAPLLEVHELLEMPSDHILGIGKIAAKMQTVLVSRTIPKRSEETEGVRMKKAVDTVPRGTKKSRTVANGSQTEEKAKDLKLIRNKIAVLQKKELSLDELEKQLFASKATPKKR